MIFTVEFTKQAEDDLRGIFDYIAIELQSIDNAISQLNCLEENIMKLDQMPERYRLYGNEKWQSRGLRLVPVDNYCVLYVVDK